MKYTVWLKKDGQWEPFKDIDLDTLRRESGAEIGNSAIIGDWAEIGDRAKIGNRAKIGDRAKIGNRAKIGDWVEIGDRAEIGNSAEIGDGAKIGDWVEIGNSAIIGDRAEILEQRDLFCVGPQGSRDSMLWAWVKNKEIHIGTGCGDGPISDFERAVRKEHGTNKYAKEYDRSLRWVREYFNEDKLNDKR